MNWLLLVLSFGFAETIPQDIYVRPSSAWASSTQTGEEIEKSYGGDMDTIYHSNWGSKTYPINISYYFDGTKTIDYLVYYPRTDGSSNGLFGEVEIWYSLKGDDGALIKYRDFDFGKSSTPKTVRFTPPLVDAETIQLIVKSSQSSEGMAFASCAEMEFFERNPEWQQLDSFFTDTTYSDLRPGFVEADLATITNTFFAQLASDLYQATYKKEFRVLEYQACQNPDVMAQELKMARYGLNDNPTGIYVGAGDEVVLFVGQTFGTVPSLFIQEPQGAISGTLYALKEGENVISNVSHEGLLYIRYYTPTAAEPAVKINIVSGSVNGFFDFEKHTQDDWTRLLGEATYSNFDVKGKYVTMNFETQAFREYTGEDGPKLIEMYDKLVWLQQDFMGLHKYNRVYKNRVHMQVAYGDTFMYATSYYTAFGFGTQSTLLSVERLTNPDHKPEYRGGCWGPAHEVGHVNQVRPGLKWAGMTEITNNIYSCYIQTMFENDSLLDYGEAYADAKEYIIANNTDDNPDNDVAINAYRETHRMTHHFVLVASFWQLQLYLSNVLNKTDFYKDLIEELRLTDYGNHSDFATDGFYQMNFVKLACKHANLDLMEFFQAWGYFTPIDEDIDDYGISRFTITQAQINAAKYEIATKYYPRTPAEEGGRKIYDITDSNWKDYRIDPNWNSGSIEEGTSLVMRRRLLLVLVVVFVLVSI